jgi:preprotein translocase subunit SecG
MTGIIFALQILSGVISVFFVLVKEPKSEGLGSIGGSATTFKGVRTSADAKLENMTWFFVITFLTCSAYLGLIANQF